VLKIHHTVAIGRMVERLHADMARRTVAIADAIAKTLPA